MEVVVDNNGIVKTKLVCSIDGVIGTIDVEVVASQYCGKFMDEYLYQWLVLHRGKDGKIVYFNASSTANTPPNVDRWDKDVNLQILSMNKEDFKSTIDTYEKFHATGTLYGRDRIVLDNMYRSVIDKYMDRMMIGVMDTICNSTDGAEVATKLTNIPKHNAKVKIINLGGLK